MTDETISPATLRRLPIYLQYLLERQAENREFVSAAQMAAALGVHPTLVRQDLDRIGATGLPRRGHRLDATVDAIETFFQGKRRLSAFLIGAGNLATALIGYRQLERAGIELLAAFDRQPEKVGSSLLGIEVVSVTKFVDLVRRMRVTMAILTLPPSAADEATRLIVDSGVRAVWNFMPATLRLPERIIVENVNLFSSLSVLKRRITESFSNKESANEHGNA